MRFFHTVVAAVVVVASLGIPAGAETFVVFP